jgi:tetratricopeptide (TPR) repeat protein/transcriptional regulator with XRE-family HTH domain
MSQTELAQRSGLSIRMIRDLENGRTWRPLPDSVDRLADALELRAAARARFVTSAGRPVTNAAPKADVPASRSTRGNAARNVVPRQLPAGVPGFAGRDEQLALLSQVLDQPGGTAIITAIGGTAGVGKTALAIHWAHQVAGEFPDGQIFVNLRGFDPSGTLVTTADAVRAFLDALGVAADRVPGTTEAQLGLYRSLMAGRRMLVVLDNAREAAQVRPLLPGSATCRVLVTSRNQLTGLIALDAARPLNLDVLSDEEARQLLRYRLGADRVAAEPGAADQLIRACAHLPLALCIIAAQAAVRPDLSLGQVAADLTGRPVLDVVSTENDPAADVRAALSWSYRQLDAGPARLFRLAGLHPGAGLEPFAVAALADQAVSQAGRALQSLANACVVHAAGPGRYGLHDLLRGYARELAQTLESQAERRAALTRLLDYYSYATATAMDVLFPAERHRRPAVTPPQTPAPTFPDEVAALAWLDDQRADLVAACVHAAEHGWPQHAVRLATIMFRYLDSSALFAEAIAVHTSASSAARQIGDRAAEATALHSIGVVHLRQGRYQQATEHYEQALARYENAGDSSGQARSLANLGVAELLQGRPQDAIGYFQRSLALHRASGDQAGEARALGNLGFADLRRGRYAEATAHLQQSLELGRKVNDKAGEARALANIGEVELRQDHYQPAADHLREALALFRHIGDRTSEADTLANLGITELRQGHHEQASANLHDALAICTQTGDVSRQALTLNGLGELLLATGQPAQACARHAAALDLASQDGERYEQARAHEGLAIAYQAGGATARAHRHWEEALAGYTELGAPEADRVRANAVLSKPISAAG